MNKIEKLIDELCPQGVEFREVKELLNSKLIVTVSPPKKLTKKHYKSSGNFPIVDQGQDFIVAYTNNKNTVLAKYEYVIFGDHTELIKYVNFAFAQGADGIKILKTNGMSAKYLYYALNNFYKKTGKYTRHFSFLKKTEIPIPPLSIQKEIVKILDNFTQIEAELEAELEARKKQYEYYRNQLLTFKCRGEPCVRPIQTTEQTTEQTTGEYNGRIQGANTRANTRFAPTEPEMTRPPVRINENEI